MSLLLNSIDLAERLGSGVLTFNSHVPIPPPLRRVVTSADHSSEKHSAAQTICLTFDDGPDPEFTPRLLDVLAEHNAKATFFVLGEAAAQYPLLVEKIVKAGHALGNHTYSHKHPWLVSTENAVQEVVRANAVIKDITGYTPFWFRPPYGRLRNAMRAQALTEKMTTVLWNHSIVDWGMWGTENAIARRLEKITAGDIVLLHDGRPEHNRPAATLKCLPTFLQSLKDKSLVAKSLDEVFPGGLTY